MKLNRHDLDFLRQLSLGARPRWRDIGTLGLRLAEGKLVEEIAGYCSMTDAGRGALQRAQLARLA